MDNLTFWQLGGLSMTENYLNFRGVATGRETRAAVLFSLVAYLCGLVIVFAIASLASLLLGLSFVGMFGFPLLVWLLNVGLYSLTIRRLRALSNRAAYLLAGVRILMSLFALVVVCWSFYAETQYREVYFSDIATTVHALGIFEGVFHLLYLFVLSFISERVE